MINNKFAQDTSSPTPTATPTSVMAEFFCIDLNNPSQFLKIQANINDILAYDSALIEKIKNAFNKKYNKIPPEAVKVQFIKLVDQNTPSTADVNTSGEYDDGTDKNITFVSEKLKFEFPVLNLRLQEMEAMKRDENFLLDIPTKIRTFREDLDKAYRRDRTLEASQYESMIKRLRALRKEYDAILNR